MNCAEFENAIAADPGCMPAGGDAHLASCAACLALWNEYRELDQRIAKALAIEVPPLTMPPLEELEHDAGKVTVLQTRRRMTAPVWFGIAATVALAAWLGLALQQPAVDELSLSEQVIAHLDHEAYSRVISDVPVPERTLDSVVSKDVAELDRGVGLITYARSCVINGRSIPHLVVQGKKGPITLLLMPDEPVTEAISLQGKAINGVILPLGNGSIAIIGERDEPIQDVQQSIVDSIKWKT
jgi:anti-sigma factor RsiW